MGERKYTTRASFFFFCWSSFYTIISPRVTSCRKNCFFFFFSFYSKQIKRWSFSITFALTIRTGKKKIKIKKKQNGRKKNIYIYNNSNKIVTFSTWRYFVKNLSSFFSLFFFLSIFNFFFFFLFFLELTCETSFYPNNLRAFRIISQ